MHITIENNKCVVNLDEAEFPAFEAMFDNLHDDKSVSVEFRKFPNIGGHFDWELLPMHLCRTIGEANLSSDPFATVSLYPFWKYGFAFANPKPLALALEIDDPHKKGVAADEFGMGFAAWAMEEIFHCETWADATAMIEAGLVVPTGSKCPDFVCTFPDGSLGIFEAKGTTGKVSALTQALKNGKYQAFALEAQSPIRYRVVVGTALGEPTTKVVLMDPPGPNDDESVGDGSPVPPSNARNAISAGTTTGAETAPLQTNLTAEIVRDAARRMRQHSVGEALVASRKTNEHGTDSNENRNSVGEALVASRGVANRELPGAEKREGTSPSPTGATETTTTIFRGPRGKTFALTNEYKPKKRHSWLDITKKDDK